MNIWTITLATFAVGAMILGPNLADPAFAAKPKTADSKKAEDKPADTPAANWEDPNGGQHFDKGKGRPNIANPGPTPNDAPAAAAGDPCDKPGVQCDPRDAQPPVGKRKGPKGDVDHGKKEGPKGAGESG